MKLTVAEWGVLTDEEKEQREEEMPDELSAHPAVEEDVVIIGGKPRPLKNFVGEITRKVRDDVLSEINTNRVTEPKVIDNIPKGDYISQILT